MIISHKWRPKYDLRAHVLCLCHPRTIDNAACSAEIGFIEQSVYQLYQAVTEYYPAFEWFLR